MKRVLITIALFAGACNEGGLVSERPDASAGGPTDGAASATDDLAPAPPAGDMASKTCGQMVKCLLPCGLTNFTCGQMCVTGASPQALKEFGGIAACAAQYCLLVPDAGGTNLLPCVLENCGTQVSACQGLLGFP